VLWLVALVIPLQGMAAVAMPNCASSHSAAMGTAPGQAAGSHGVHHGAVGAEPMGATAHHAPGVADHVTDNAHGGHAVPKCCSAAFSMATLVTPMAVARSHAREAAPVHPLAWLYQGVTLDGLERPPKGLLV